MGVPAYSVIWPQSDRADVFSADSVCAYALDGGHYLRACIFSDGVTSTKTHHYAKDGDSPAWTDEGSGGYSRVISSIGGDIAAIRGVDATIEFQLANLHGDIAARVSGDLVAQPGILATLESNEYGLQRNVEAVGVDRYRWIGTKQRTADMPGGIVLMGVRLTTRVLAASFRSIRTMARVATHRSMCARTPSMSSTSTAVNRTTAGAGGTVSATASIDRYQTVTGSVRSEELLLLGSDCVENTILIVVSLLAAVGSGVLASRIARRKGAEGPFWFVASRATRPGRSSTGSRTSTPASRTATDRSGGLPGRPGARVGSDVRMTLA